MKLGLCLSQELDNVHKAIFNPALTKMAELREGRITEALTKNSALSQIERIAEVEAALLAKWSYSEDWKTYLDSPLIAHADASLSLKRMYDGIVEIETGGTPYGEIFRIMGHDVFSIDYSHHKRKMKNPVIEPNILQNLRRKKNVLLVDVDIVTGKTIRTITDYLKNEGVPVSGVYLGLSMWPGIDNGEMNTINENNVNFDNFWKICGSTRQLKKEKIYRMNIIPAGFKLFTSNGKIKEGNKNYNIIGLNVARRIAYYLLNHENHNN